MILIKYFTLFPKPLNIQATYFTGKIVDKSTIADWHIIHPFPKMWNRLPDVDTTALRKLVYTKYDLKTKLDSTKAWINDYRTKQN